MAKRIYVRCICCGEEHGYDEFRVVGIRGSGRNPKYMKFDAEDRRWAAAIKHRDKVCRRCGTNTGRLESAHIFSRRYKTTRTALENGVLLCATDHRWAHSYPEEFEEWVIGWMTEQKYEELRKKAQGLSKRVKRRAS